MTTQEIAANILIALIQSDKPSVSFSQGNAEKTANATAKAFEIIHKSVIDSYNE